MLKITVIDLIAKYVVEAKFEHLPKNVVEKAKILVLDTMGCIAVGSKLPWSQIASNTVRDLGRAGKKGSTVLIYGYKATPIDAVFVNGVMAHSFELDDGSANTGAHPACCVIPTALALGERAEICGKDLITSIVVGYEVIERMAKAFTPSLQLRGFGATSTCGTFAAAATAGKILRLDQKTVANSLGIASHHSSGTLVCGFTTMEGGHVKRFMGGLAARGGIFSALLAQRGFKGVEDEIEGPRGFSKAFSGKYDLGKITDGLGEGFEIMEILTKRYAVCHVLDPVLRAIYSICDKQMVKVEDVEEIRIHCTRDHASSSTGWSLYRPPDIARAQFSIPFNVALALKTGSNFWPGDYSKETIRDEEILSLADKVKLIPREGKIFGVDEVKAELVLSDGTILSDEVEATVAMTDEEIRQKYENLASLVFSRAEVETIRKTIEKLEDAEDISDLCEMMCMRRA